MTVSDDSLAARTATIIADTRAADWKALPLERAIEGAIAHPDQIADFVHAVVAELPRSFTLLYLVLPFLPESDFPRVVADAMNALAGDPNNETAYLTITLIAMQHPAALHPYLPALFDLRDNEGAYYGETPWHEADAAIALPFLQSVIDDAARSDGDRFDAWSALLESGNLDLARYAMSVADHVPMRFSHMSARDYARYFGYEVADTADNDEDGIPSLRRLYSGPDAIYHLVFADGYVRQHGVPTMRPWLGTHPTWHLAPIPDTAPLNFGGLLGDAISAPANIPATSCAACGGPLQRLVTLAPVPDGLGVTGMASLTLVTCLSCVFQAPEGLYFAHDAEGVPSPTAYDGFATEPYGPAEMFVPTQVRLAHTPPRWRWQDWGKSNGNENLSRFGGVPAWIQDASYNACPRCAQAMTALLQLANEMPVQPIGNGDDVDLDSARDWMEGITYILWCDACKISGVLCQMT